MIGESGLRYKCIAISLQSVLNSDYPDFEVIVVNDGSTDNTEAEVQAFLSDPRVRYIKKPNGGKAAVYRSTAFSRKRTWSSVTLSKKPNTGESGVVANSAPM